MRVRVGVEYSIKVSLIVAEINSTDQPATPVRVSIYQSTTDCSVDVAEINSTDQLATPVRHCEDIADCMH